MADTVEQVAAADELGVYEDEVYADEADAGDGVVDYAIDHAGVDSSDESLSFSDEEDTEVRRISDDNIPRSEQVHMLHMRRFLEELTEKVTEKEYVVLKTREELKKCRLHLEQLEKDGNLIFAEIQTAEQSGNSAAMFRLQSQHDKLCQEIENESRLEAQIKDTLDEAEYELAQAEVERGKYQLVDEELKQKEEKMQTKRLEMAEERNNKEQAYALKAEDNRMRKEREEIEEQRERERRFKLAQDETRRSKEKANKYLKETMAKIRRHQSEEEIRQKMHIENRIKSMLALKRDITSNRENLRALQARDSAVKRTKEEEEIAQKQDILDDGGNPDREMLKKKTLLQYDRNKELFDMKQKERQTQIAYKILQEDEQMKRRMAQQPYLWQDAKKDKSKEVSSHKKRKLKIFDQSVENVSEPESSNVVTESLNLRSGESSDEEIETKHFMDYKRDDLPDSSSDDEGNVNLAKPEFEGLWNQHKPYKVPKDIDAAPKPPGASKMDQEIMARVMEKHREGIVVKQVAGGREFKGQPFYSKPDVIHFKDFDVGKTYKKKVTLTNVSYSVNYCKLIGITEHLKDFIHIHFDPPGQMSAGLTCEMLVTFQPMINEDLSGEVSFLAQTGPFSIPLICSTKKCDLSVDTSFVDFGTTVIGETLKRTFTLTNNGALASKFEFIKMTGLKPRTVTTAETSLGRLTTGDINSEIDETEKSKEVDTKKQAQTDKPQEETTTEEGVAPEGEGEMSKSQMLDLPVGEAEIIRSVASSVDLPVSDYDDIAALDGMKVGQISSGEIGPFSSVKLEVIWQPTIPGRVNTDFAIHFSDPLSENIPVKTVANAIDVPVWVERQNVDLKICLLDRLYQDTIIVNNRATTALKLNFEVCSELKNHLELLPKTGYIQAQSQFSAQLKFLPRQSLFEEGGKYFDRSTGVLEAPMTIRVADQTRPVHFTVHAVVTSSDMEFDVVNIDFGHCTIYESVKTEVKLTNKSILPQQFGFLGIPDYVDVQPNDGFGTLLPLETISLDIIFKPNKARVYSFELSCKSLINREFKLYCQGVGVHPPLQLSHQVVSFAATAMNDVSSAALHVVNSHTSMNEYTHPVPRIGRGEIAPVGPTSFEFVVPEDAPLTVSPSVGTVQPGKKCKVHIRYAPKITEELIRKEAVRMAKKALDLRAQREYEEALQQQKENEENSAAAQKKKPAKGKASPKGKGGKANEAAANVILKGPTPATPPTENSIDLESDEYAAAHASLLRQYESKFHSYVIPCYVASGKLTNPGELPYSIHNTLYLEVHCPSVKPELVVISDNGRTTTDFGEVSIGQNVVKSVTLQNISEKNVDLRASSLDTAATFQILNALRVLPPDGSHTMLISFTPTTGRVFQEVLMIKCPTSRMAITLKGKGVSPQVRLSVPDNVMDMGAVLANEYREETFKIENTSSLSIQYSIKLDSLSLLRYKKSQGLPEFIKPDSNIKNLVGPQNYNGQNVFDCVPAEGVIPAGESQEVMVTFAPDHPSDHYSDAARIELFGQEEAHVFRLVGVAKPHVMFMTGGDPLTPNVESLSVQPVQEPDEDGKLPPIPMLVTLRSLRKDNEVMTASRDIYAGCVRTMAVSQKKNGEFSFENIQAIAAKGFNIEPQKGMVEAGNKKPVTITWTPPKGHDPNQPAEASINVTLKGDVTEVYRIILRAFVVSE